MTVSEALQIFNTEYIWPHGYALDTANNYRWAINSFVKACPKVALEQITLDHIYKWRKKMELEQVELNAVICFLYKMRLFLRWWARRAKLLIEPSDIIIPRRKVAAPKCLTREQIQALINVGGTREKALIALLYSTGMRVGELVQVRRRDIQGETIKIRGKGNKERIVFVDETTQIYLQDYIASRTDSVPFLFYSRKIAGLTVSGVQQIVRQLGKDAGIMCEVTPHVLRHSYATHMAQEGVSAYHLQRLLGHADISTTQIYVHLSGADLKNAYQKFHHAL